MPCLFPLSQMPTRNECNVKVGRQTRYPKVMREALVPQPGYRRQPLHGTNDRLPNPKLSFLRFIGVRLRGENRARVKVALSARASPWSP